MKLRLDSHRAHGLSYSARISCQSVNSSRILHGCWSRRQPKIFEFVVYKVPSSCEWNETFSLRFAYTYSQVAEIFVFCRRTDFDFVEPKKKHEIIPLVGWMVIRIVKWAIRTVQCYLHSLWNYVNYSNR